MKKTQKIVLAIVFALSLIMAQNSFAATDPPNPPGEHGQNGDQVAGGGAPVGGGLFILLGLGAAYGSKKWYDHKKETLEE